MIHLPILLVIPPSHSEGRWSIDQMLLMQENSSTRCEPQDILKNQERDLQGANHMQSKKDSKMCE